MSSTNLISPTTNVPNRNSISQVTYITSPPSGEPGGRKRNFYVLRSGRKQPPPAGSACTRQSLPCANAFCLASVATKRCALCCLVFPSPRVSPAAFLLYTLGGALSRPLSKSPCGERFLPPQGVCLRGAGRCQIVPDTVSVAVPGVVTQTPSVPCAKVAAGTVIRPGTVANTPVVSL